MEEGIILTNLWVWIVLLVIILERTASKRISTRNERWLIERGGRAPKETHYRGLLLVQYLAFSSVVVELLYIKQTEVVFNRFFFICCLIVLCCKWWCIRSAGVFWNTKKITLPRVRLFKQGPYRYVKNPDYLLTLLEIAFISVLFGAYITAFVYPLLYIFFFKLTQSETQKVYKNA
ncbi:isoprenylcysteine carboxylmethyltransferase family protein [Oceanobacillus kapialis]|uniref:isoprenylcysteine carboxylmethyltransferase family protein n=1 Tax=Oceanobacillus kapialis TaxID=481353 RepID=UPI00384A7772